MREHLRHAQNAHECSFFGKRLFYLPDGLTADCLALFSEVLILLLAREDELLVDVRQRLCGLRSLTCIVHNWLNAISNKPSAYFGTLGSKARP
jgi:hypothetical protein